MLKFSIIIPIYNAELTLKRCFESLLNQSLPRNEYEIIAVDNNSSDLSSQIAKEYADIFVTNKLKSRSLTRNIGANHASADYLVFVDSDCELSPKLLEQAWLSLKEGHEVIQPKIIPKSYEQENIYSRFYFQQAFAGTKGTFSSLNNENVDTATLIVTKSLFQQVGGFDPLLKRFEDRHFGRSCLESGVKLQTLDKSLTIKYVLKESYYSFIKKCVSDNKARAYSDICFNRKAKRKISAVFKVFSLKKSELKKLHILNVIFSYLSYVCFYSYYRIKAKT